MRSPTLLVVTNKADPHADEVIRLLDVRQTLTPLRLNTEDLFTGCRYTFRWQADGEPSCSKLEILDSGRTADAVRVAWWRKPAPLQPPPDLTHPEAVRVAKEEAKILLRCLDAPFPNLSWVNHPETLITASRKLRQIQVAAAAGLSIPETIVTNSGTDVVDFVKQYRRCIIKPLSAGSFVYEGKQWGLFTHQLKLTDLEALLDMVGYAPVMVQRELEKYQELRITIIGDKVFPCAIDTSTSDFQDVRTDWRVIAPEKIPHSLVTIPVSLSHALCSILAHYGLNYGAFDVIQEPDGRYYFLELNPNGQYLWIELLTGAPLSVAMVELIEGLAAVPAQGTFSNREPMGVSRCC